ncbi:MAG TPA: GspE/PulE family protein, partial [Candidatus Omnitrophota bacterium]|nr:GspE/PulE family protein [Candidatus Omnitrophota bacterium]
KDRLNISDTQWQECVSEHERTGISLAKIILSRNIVTEENLLQALSQDLGLAYDRLKTDDVDADLAKKIPAKIVTHYDFMPIREKEGVLQIAVNDPLELLQLDEIRLYLNKKIEPMLASRKDIHEAIKNFYGLGAETLEEMSKQAAQEPGFELLKPPKSENIKDDAIDPSVIKFINQILSDAIKQRATDIHFEPFEDDLRIRYRIDGVLYEVPCPPTIKHFQASIASRIKVMADLDIAEKRRPQDGRIDVKMDNEVYDLRVSIMPTPFGESIGVRLLPRSSPIIGLEGLGLSRSELDILEKSIEKPYGIILVTGPTGSGKTTTLYSCLNKINSPQRKILTIEDPIEYQLKGITQMQVEPKTGFTFANALRSMLRHDPDVMMVGEIRDMETAELAVRTSLTGHLVFSTLHTNDAAGGITRLLDMNIDSFLVSSSIILIIAQRLVRTICPHCKERYRPEPHYLKQFDAAALAEAHVFRGKGCEACRMTGYQGRTGIFEMLTISDEIRELILKKNPSHLIKQKAVSLGMKALRQSGWEKIKQGATTIDEVLRVTQEEEA